LAAPLNPVFASYRGYGHAFSEYPYGALSLSDFLVRKAKNGMRDMREELPLIKYNPLVAKFSNEDRWALSLGREPVRYYWEGDAKDLQCQQILTRHDQPLSRGRWQFSQRLEHLLIRTEDD
jgi:CRISPR system Cascade subunit CasD